MFSMSTFEANAEGNQPDNNVVIVKSPWVKRTPKRQQPIVLSYDHITKKANLHIITSLNNVVVVQYKDGLLYDVVSLGDVDSADYQFNLSDIGTYGFEVYSSSEIVFQDILEVED